MSVDLLSASRDQLIHEILRLRGELAARVDPVTDVEAFHDRFGVGYDGRPRALPRDLMEFREKFLAEELQEYVDASISAEYGVSWGDPEMVDYLARSLDALVDLVYVAIGTSVMHGFNFREAWRRVHEANMRKQRAASAEETKRGHAMDVVKPPGWEAPNLTDLVQEHAHR